MDEIDFVVCNTISWCFHSKISKYIFNKHKNVLQPSFSISSSPLSATKVISNLDSLCKKTFISQKLDMQIFLYYLNFENVWNYVWKSYDFFDLNKRNSFDNVIEVNWWNLKNKFLSTCYEKTFIFLHVFVSQRAIMSIASMEMKNIEWCRLLNECALLLLMKSDILMLLTKINRCVEWNKLRVY